MVDLKNCPFCGSFSVTAFQNVVVCDLCSSSGPDLGHTKDVLGSAYAWNKRSADKEVLDAGLKMDKFAKIAEQREADLIKWLVKIKKESKKQKPNPDLIYDLACSALDENLGPMLSLIGPRE